MSEYKRSCPRAIEILQHIPHVIPCEKVRYIYVAFNSAMCTNAIS